MDETEKRIIGTFARKEEKKEIRKSQCDTTRRRSANGLGAKSAEKGNANSRLSITRVIHLGRSVRPVAVSR